jgi:putative tryptophan/tyrosine transport system permease protein
MIFTIVLIIVEQAMMHLPLMLGAYISFSLLKVPDLSIESAYVVGAILGSYAVIMASHLPLSVSILIALGGSMLGGVLVGITSSLLTQKGKFPHLLSSIVTFGLFHGINQFIAPVYMSLSMVQNPLTLLNCIQQHPELIILVILGCIIGLIVSFVFTRQLGYSYAVYGNNPHFFRNYGISTSFVFITGIVFANGLAGISGYLFAQSNMFVELNMGLGKSLLCISGLVLGKEMVPIKKSFSILIPLMGTFIYFTLQQLLLKSGFNLKYFTAVQAFIVLCILVYSYRKKPQRFFNNNLGV